MTVDELRDKLLSCETDAVVFVDDEPLAAVVDIPCDSGNGNLYLWSKKRLMRGDNAAQG